ncbi:tail tape measure protein [Pseudomonas palleroniana]|uniref:tail tape measure protein n=1 Tax=Pseudomonas palleroniana TaxID=191390 RepID=UPI001FD0C414|nr:tail tape measure protein [Pseudomonas palleroniana]UOP08813.1 tail tape measure protein [Pseudomonas palleroniana]
MQETQSGMRLAQEDKRWLLDDADLGSVLAPFSASLAAPASLDAAPRPQQDPQSVLASALVTVSVDINALTLEQVQLREALETLTSTLFITGNTLATKTVEVSGEPAKSQPKEPAPASTSWVDKGLQGATDAGKFVGKELLTSLWDKAKERVSDKALDAVADKFPTAAKWLKKDDKGKGSNAGKECCCTGALPAGIRGPLDSATAQLPERVGETARDKDSGKGKPSAKANAKGPRGKRYKTRQATSRSIKTSVVRKRADLKSQLTGLSAPVSQPLNVMGQPLRAFDSKLASQGSTRLPGNTFASYAAPSTARPTTHSAANGQVTGLFDALGKPESATAGRLGPLKVVDTAIDGAQGIRNGGAKAIGAGLGTAGGALLGASAGSAIGTLTRLESAAARRLGPLKYVDTAIDVVQGVRNGDAKAVGAGLSTAGGAWAGASAGAAIGTMIFPGVGTAVGGAIGGLLGSEAGSWLGDKLFGASDRLPAPADVSKNLNSAQADNRQINFAPQITINAPEPASHQQLAELVVQQIEAQFSPLSMNDLLGSRRDAALTDIGGV